LLLPISITFLPVLENRTPYRHLCTYEHKRRRREALTGALYSLWRAAGGDQLLRLPAVRSSRSAVPRCRISHLKRAESRPPLVYVARWYTPLPTACHGTV